ncbi:MAG TPA: TonB C-terminal domain-containing protein [Longimicrobium sp.]|nr:TonB C-terminal domain-containing protein [Longimicrobium sp.]
MKPIVPIILAGLCLALPAAAQDNMLPEAAARACREAPRKVTTRNTATYNANTSDPAYAARVFDAIYAQWQQAEFVEGDWTELRFNVLRDGKVSPMTIAHRSKSDDRDLEAMRAVARAVLITKLPPFPADYPVDTIPMMIALGDVSSYEDAGAANRRLPEPSRLNPRPEWPTRMLAENEVHVIADFQIEVNGRIDMSTVRIVASPHPRLTAELMRVLPSWRFAPALVDCVPVRSSFRIRQGFEGTPRRLDRRTNPRFDP